MPIVIAKVLGKIFQWLYRLIIFLIGTTLKVLMVVSFPLHFVSTENKYLKFNDYFYVKGPRLWIWWQHLLYIAWGYIGGIIVYFVIFFKQNYQVFSNKILLGFSDGISFYFIVTTLCLIYFFQIKTIEKPQCSRTSISNLSVANTAVKIGLAVFLITCVSFVQYMGQTELFDAKTGSFSDLNIAFYKESFFRELLIKNIVIFLSPIAIKTALLLTDRNYELQKIEELEGILGRNP